MSFVLAAVIRLRYVRHALKPVTFLLELVHIPSIAQSLPYFRYTGKDKNVSEYAKKYILPHFVHA